MNDEIRKIEEQIAALKKQLTEARRQRAAEPVSDYEFRTAEGTVALSALFGDKDDLLIIHNMGAGCPYCTLWADGFTGLLPHIGSRASFVVVSPDTPDAQAIFAAGRGWKFRMVSDNGSDFTSDMGFLMPGEGHYPGVSAFHCGANGEITRTGSTFFGPGDDFCAIWPMFDLLADGDNGWEPKFQYKSGE